jgi:SNF2 family DNA or RNA helicase
MDSVVTKITVENDRIVVTGAPDYARGMFNSIPAALDRHNGTWWYPMSPFSMGRLARKIGENQIEFSFDNTTNLVYAQMLGMIEVARRKDINAIEPGRSLTTTAPWNHQRTASGWLSSKPYGYLAMKMGTGKTLVAINELLIRQPKTTLIMCPKSVIDVWVDEFSKHAEGSDHLMIPLKKGTSKFKAEYAASRYRDAIIMNRPAVFIVNYETAWRELIAKFIVKLCPEVVIADEAHRCKAPGSRISRFAAKLFRISGFRLLLSGTPLPNNQLDAYGQYRFMDPGIFGTNFSRFRARYAEVATYKGFPEIISWRNQEEFRNILNLTMFRVDEDVLDLPPINHVRIFTEVTGKSRRVYEQLMKAFVADVASGEVTASNALARLMKFQQITSGFIIDDDGGVTDLDREKENALADIIDGVLGEPVVVFCRFKHDLMVIRKVAESCGRVYGEVSGSGNCLQGGKIPGGVDVLGVQIAAGGVGVNLNASRLCVFFSLGFSLAEYEQAIARLHRGGQTRPVTVYHLIARDTVDEHIYGALAAKKKVIDSIMNYVKGERE